LNFGAQLFEKNFVAFVFFVVKKVFAVDSPLHFNL